MNEKIEKRPYNATLGAPGRINALEKRHFAKLEDAIKWAKKRLGIMIQDEKAENIIIYKNGSIAWSYGEFE